MEYNAFDEANIASETQRFLELFEREQAKSPGIHEVDIIEARLARDNGLSYFPFRSPSEEVQELLIARSDGSNIKVRVIRPKCKPVGILIHIHGGGWTFGRPQHQDWRMTEFSKHVGLITASIEYRLAPENPWPLCLEDCETATKWILDNRTSFFGVDKVAICGESAGAHLSVGTLLRLKNTTKLDAFVGALLSYGWFDLSLTPSARNWGFKKLVLSTPALEFFIKNLQIGDLPTKDPFLSPIYGDLSDMPDALFQCGTLDPLSDDTAFMHAKWLNTENKAELIWYPGGVHAFDSLDSSMATDTLSHSVEFFRRKFQA